VSIHIALVSAMWGDLLAWIDKNKLADLFGIAGTLISLVGFTVTIIGVYRSKNAAVKAQEAAQAARDSIRMLDTFVDFSAAISLLEEIKRLHRQEGAWQILIERYGAIRRLLVQIRTSEVDLSDDQQEAFQNALTNLRAIQNRVEKGLTNTASLKPANFNNTISDDIDRLLAVLTQLKAKQAGGTL
jgi:hypothetical protein